MIIDIDNKLLDSMFVDTFNVLDSEVKVAFEEKVVVSKGIDLGIFKNVENVRLNDTLIKTNLSNLSDILKQSNEKILSVNLEGTNPVASEIFSMVLADINDGRSIKVQATSEMEDNTISENIAFLSMKTKNKKLQEEEQNSFKNALETVVNNMKSVLVGGESYAMTYNDKVETFELGESIGKGLSVLASLPSFLISDFNIEAVNVINCYSNCHCNCHSNCYSNCHGSRGWR